MGADGAEKEKIIKRAATQKPPEYPIYTESPTGGVMPMQIAGRFHNERARLGPDFNDAERRWRVRWHHDQELHPSEPRPELPELKAEKYWWLRRLYRKPLDILEERILAPRIGLEGAEAVRKLLGKGSLFYIASLVIWYNLKYRGQDWQVLKRPIFYWIRPEVFPGEEGYPLVEKKEKSEWFDCNFSTRNVFLNVHDPNRWKY